MRGRGSGRGTECNRGEQTDFGVCRFKPYLKQAVIEVGVDGFVVDVDAFDNGGRQPTTTFQHSAAIHPVLLPVVSSP